MDNIRERLYYMKLKTFDKLGWSIFLKRAVEFTENDPPPTMEKRKNACKEFQKEMTALLNREWIDVDVIRISKELRKRQSMLFTFMVFQGVPWYNNDAESAMRKGVLHGKISGGRRTWTGAGVFEVLHWS